MKKKTDHFRLIRQGLVYHESFRYGKALPYFQCALKAQAGCPSAIYNLANTLHMLNRDKEAAALLHQLIEASDEQLISGCPESDEDPKSYKLDAYFLMFHVKLHGGVPWESAYPYAQEHLARRNDDLESVWTMSDVTKEIESLRCKFE